MALCIVLKSDDTGFVIGNVRHVGMESVIWMRRMM